MATMISACGVLCSDCPAYLGDEKGAAHQQQTAAAWKRIYGLDVPAGNIACHGCLGPDDELFHTSRACKARLCCRSKGFSTCAECPEEHCPVLEKAQAAYDRLPDLARTLSPEDFATYAQPYCNHRQRLVELRPAGAHRSQ